MQYRLALPIGDERDGGEVSLPRHHAPLGPGYGSRSSLFPFFAPMPLRLSNRVFSCRKPSAAVASFSGPRAVAPLLSLLVAACATSPARPSEAGVVHLTLVATNDTHGWVEPHEAKLGRGRVAQQGGAETFAGYLAILRDENPGGVVLLDAGDLFQGTLLSNSTEGAAVTEVYNRLGYAASAVGNHEFDYGPVGPHAVATQPGEDALGALKARIGQARFPFLAANILDAQSGEHASWMGNDGTRLLEVNGVKVGLVGLSTISTPTTTNPMNVEGLKFAPLAPTALSAARKLRAEGAEVLVLLAHAGAKCGSLANPDDLSSCDPRDSEIFDVLRALPPNTFDAVIAGHTHQPIGHRVQGTPVIESSALLRSFGVIDLYFDTTRHALLRERTTLRAEVPICAQVAVETHGCDSRSIADTREPLAPAFFEGRAVERDASLASLLEPFQAQVRELQERDTGVRVGSRLGRSYAKESPLGDVLADALREAAHADVALMNPGGLRADLPAGPLTYGALYEVLPFDNTVSTLRVTGAQLQQLLSLAYSRPDGVFQESGLQLSLAACAGPGRLRGAVLADGRAIEPASSYVVALPDFLARGGGGLAPALRGLGAKNIALNDGAPPLRDALLDVWRRRGVSLEAPAQPRIRLESSGTPCPVEDPQ
jgi:5'-nucleotidase